MTPIRVSREEPGFVLSAVTHVALLVVAVLGLADAKTFEDAQESVSVEMISEAEMKQLTQGEKTAKQVIPDAKLRVDKVAPQIKQDDPGEKKQELAAPLPAPALPPVRPVEIAKAEPQKVAPQVPLPPAVQPPVQPAPVLPPVRPAELPKAEVKKVALAQPSQDDEPDPDAEVIRQAAKKAPIPRKEDAPETKAKADAAAREAALKAQEQAKAEDARKKAEEQRAEDQKQAEQKKVADAKAAAAAQAAADAASDAKADAEEKAKAQEQAKADAKTKADAEAKKKALAAKAAAEAEAKRQAEFNKALRSKLASAASSANGGNGQQLPSDRVASATGSTGAAINRNPSSLGAPNATGTKLNPSERAGLSEAVADQVSPKVSYSGTRPVILPKFKVLVGRDGSLLSQPELVNPSSDPSFQALAAAGTRAIRLAAPLRIEARYASSYEDWKYMIIQINPDN